MSYEEEFRRILAGEASVDEQYSFLRMVKACPEANGVVGDLYRRLFWDCETDEDYELRFANIRFAGIDCYLAHEELEDIDTTPTNPHRVIQVGPDSVILHQWSSGWEAYHIDLKLPYAANTLVQVLLDTKIQTLDTIEGLYSRPLKSLIQDDIDRLNHIQAAGGLAQWQEAFIQAIDDHISVAQLMEE